MSCPIKFFEIWKDVTINEIPWIKENSYRVSSFGQVYSYISNRLLTPFITNCGYYSIALATNNGLKAKPIRLNRLVLMVFNPIPNPEKMVAHHLNSNILDNRLCNLMWVDYKFNTHYGMRYGNIHPEIYNAGEKSGSSKLTEKQVYEILDLAKNRTMKLKEIAIKYGVSEGTIGDIVYYRTWKHLNMNIGYTRIYDRAVSDEDIQKICNFFENNDINNKEKFTCRKDLIKKCLIACNLDNKYDANSARLVDILLKRNAYKIKTLNYSYNWID